MKKERQMPRAQYQGKEVGREKEWKLLEEENMWRSISEGYNPIIETTIYPIHHGL